jgi:PEP-CTERM motif
VDSRKSLRAVAFAAAMVALMAGATQAAPVTPSFDVFGSLPAATFGGSGIPNDAVAITTIISGNDTITLGLTATQRFFNPALGNDGAGTFSAGAGANFGLPPSTSTNLGATWNFNYYIDIQGGGTIADYNIELLYDFDPGAATDEASLGSIDFNVAGAGGLSLLQDSQNLLFAFLGGVPVIPGITPPGGAFDPFAAGEYSFALRVGAIGGGQLGQSAINVNVVAVPEPGTIAIFGLGLVALGLIRRRKTA